MRIGIMLRSLDEKGEVGVYTRYLTQKLLEVDRRNHYVLFYRDPAHLGGFAYHTNVTERIVMAPYKALWDQVAVPLHSLENTARRTAPSKIYVPLVMTTGSC